MEEATNREKMKIVLVNPPLTTEERYGVHFRSGGQTPPLGLACLAAVLREHGHDIRIVDGTLFNNYTDVVLIENGGGIYYFDYNFDSEGVWHGTFYEDEVKVASQNFRIRRSFLGRGFLSWGSSRLINR